MIGQATKSTWQIIFSGVGGQGLMVAGDILGKAAVEHEGRFAVMSSAYGVETRGTFTKSDIIVSNEAIFFPEVLAPDVIVILDTVAYQRYVGTDAANLLLIYDDSIQVMPGKAQQLGFPIAKMAREIGNTAVANVISVGILIGLTSIVSPQAASAAIKDEFSLRPRIVEINLRALQAGVEAGLLLEHPAEGGR